MTYANMCRVLAQVWSFASDMVLSYIVILGIHLVFGNCTFFIGVLARCDSLDLLCPSMFCLRGGGCFYNTKPVISIEAEILIVFLGDLM